MKLCSCLVVLAAVSVEGELKVLHNESVLKYDGENCPATKPGPCNTFESRFKEVDTVGSNIWKELNGDQCNTQLEQFDCRVEVEIAVRVSGTDSCPTYLGYSVDPTYFSDRWHVRQIRNAGPDFPACANSGGRFSTQQIDLCSDRTDGDALLFGTSGAVLEIESSNPSAELIFPDCPDGELTIIVASHLNMITPPEPTTEQETTKDPSKSETSSQTEDPDPPEDTEDEDKSPGTEHSDKTVTENTNSTPGRAVPASATRSAVLSILPLAIIGTIY